MKPRFFPNAAEFGRWLDAHASSALEIWVGYYKVGGKPSLTWPQSVDEALCFGWIDGIRKRIDDHSYCIRFGTLRAREQPQVRLRGFFDVETRTWLRGLRNLDTGG